MRISALALSYVIGTLTSSTTGSFVWQCQGFTHTVLTHSSSRSSSSSSSSSSSIVVPSSSSLHYHNHRHNHRRNRVGGSNDRKLSSSSVLFVRPPSMTNDKAWKWSRRMRRFVTSATVAALPFVVGPSDVQAKVPFGWTGESITEMIIKDAQNEELDIRQAAELEHTAKLNAIRREKGEFAAKQFDETFKAKLRLEDAQKSLQTAMLKRDLLLKGIQPNSLEFNGYLFEKLYGVNLFEVPGTEYQTVFGELQKMSPEELQQKRKENLVTYKEEIDEALKIVELSKANVKRMAASLGVEVDLGEDDQAIASTEVVPSDKEKLKLEKAKAKEEAKLLKEKKKAENKAAKEEANRLKAELKAKAKKEKDDLQLAAKAAAAAAAGTVAAGQAAANEVASQVVEQTNMASMITEDGVEQHITSDDQADVTDQSSMALVNDKESNIGTSSTKDGKFKIIKTAGASIGVGVVAFQGWAVYKKRSDDAEAKRMEQFKLIMGNSDSEDAPDEPTSFDDSVSSKYNQFSSGSEPSEPIVETTLESANEVSGPQDTNVEPAVVPEIGKKKKKKGIAGIFSKNDENARETDINNLFVSSAVASNFSKVLAGILTFGAPGRFPEIESLEGRPSTFELESAKEILSQTREDEGLTTVQAAESFACVVNCMIITIIDLASSTLKEKDDKVTVDALNVVLDFMDHAASLYDAVADVSTKEALFNMKYPLKTDFELFF